MIKDADVVGLTEEQSRRFQEIDDEVSQTREGVAVWHRLLDRRRHDRKLGLHPITEFAVGEKPSDQEQGTLVKRANDTSETPSAREPFYVRSESEARALLIRCVGYLSNTDARSATQASRQVSANLMRPALRQITQISASNVLTTGASTNPATTGERNGRK